MGSVVMSTIKYLSRDFLVAAGMSCGNIRLPWPVYSFLNACGLFRRTHARTRRRGRGGGATRLIVRQRSLLGLVNARSLLNKCELISNHLIDARLDLLAVTETWLNSDIGDSTIKAACPDGYTAVQLPRLNRKGGGLALIHKSSIEAK